MCAALGEGRGPGGCPPGITQPTVVPTVGAGAWQCAQKLGSHDECLGGRVCEVTEIFDGHKSLQAAALSAAGLAGLLCMRARVRGVPCSCMTGHIPFPAALKFCWQIHSLLPRK